MGFTTTIRRNICHTIWIPSENEKKELRNSPSGTFRLEGLFLEGTLFELVSVPVISRGTKLCIKRCKKRGGGERNLFSPLVTSRRHVPLNYRPQGATAEGTDGPGNNYLPLFLFSPPPFSPIPLCRYGRPNYTERGCKEFLFLTFFPFHFSCFRCESKILSLS